MPPVNTPDDEGTAYEFDPASVYSLLGWKTRIFGQQRYIPKRIQPVYFIGPELTDDTKGIVQTWVATQPTGTAYGIPVRQVPSSTADALGPLTPLINVQVAGNAPILGTIGVAGEYEIWGFFYEYLCDATVVTRTTTAPKLQNLFDAGTAAPIMVNSTDFYQGSTLSLTASQDGFVALETGGTEAKNQNGTLTLATGKLWFPLKLRVMSLANLAVSVSVSPATNGVAGDSHRAILWGKQVA